VSGADEAIGQYPNAERLTPARSELNYICMPRGTPSRRQKETQVLPEASPGFPFPISPVVSPGLFVCGGCFAVQDAFIRPAPRHLWQSGTESRITFLGCGRTALPVPPQDGQMSATIIGLGFFRIMSVCSSGCISKKRRERPRHRGAWGKPERICDAVASLSRDHFGPRVLPTS